MLLDFLKGNHFSINLATVPWLWETKGYLGGHQEGITPLGGETRAGFMMHAHGRGSPGTGAQGILPQGFYGLVQLMEAQVRFPGGRRSGVSAPVRPSAGFSGRAQVVNGVSGPGTDRTGGSRALAAPRQRVQRQISCRQGQCQQRRPQWALIRVQRPLGEATRLWGRKRLAVFFFFLRTRMLDLVCSRYAASLTH
jgi:hypothetical protein